MDSTIANLQSQVAREHRLKKLSRVHPEVQRLKDENARLRSRIDQLEAALADAKETQPVTSASPERPRNGRRR